MDVEKTISELCQSYRVPRSFGERMRPLLQRAAESAPEKQERLLQLVERSFVEEARRTRPSPAKASQYLTPEELKVVRTVANILHEWHPPTWLKLWTRRFDDGDDAAPPGQHGKTG